jgi:hypothetical protein
VTAALFLLLKKTDLTSEAFLCPADDATRLEADVQALSNWPGGTKHLSYSYANPYPSTPAVMAGWKFNSSSSPDRPFAADMNYGDHPKGGPTMVPFTAGKQQWRPRTARTTGSRGSRWRTPTGTSSGRPPRSPAR